MANATRRKAGATKDTMLAGFVEGYLKAALWSSMDDEGRNLDERFSAADWSQDAVDEAVRDAAAFIKDNRADLLETGAPDGKNGHDFWLTRNRHGAGFWDRGYGAAGDRLTEAAHGFGEKSVYVGDDGKLHFA